MPESYTIGRFAAAAGVHVETIRYYQRRGLIPESLRRLKAPFASQEWPSSPGTIEQ